MHTNSFATRAILKLAAVTILLASWLLVVPTTHAQTFFEFDVSSYSDNSSGVDSLLRIRQLLESIKERTEKLQQNTDYFTPTERPGYSLSETSEKFVLAPASGNAPLRVTATFVNTNTCATYSINWGDGSTTVGSDGNTGDLLACGQAFTTFTETHTYTNSGFYTVTLTGASKTYTRTVKVSELSAVTPRPGYSLSTESKEEMVDVFSKILQRLRSLQEE